MSSLPGSTRAPVGRGRDLSISPQPLDSTTYSSPSPTSTSRRSFLDDSESEDVVPRRSCISFLPPRAISRILWLADSNTFASLAILNQQWRQQASNVELYAHHLSRCPSYALSNNVISGPFRRNDLARLKAKFAAEVRRNLFAAYVSPRRTLINLVSINANSSAAFPTGEAFRFEFSPNAQTILALSSSRIYVLDATVNPPAVRRHLKTLRRPLSASVTDDGSLLAVLSTRHQVNIYALTSRCVQHLQVIVLDNAPRIIAMAREGTVLAASYETGIEVFSLAANSLTTDKRAVRSEAVDTLNFSSDGSMLIGSSLSLDNPNAVVISAPFYTENDPDLSPREVHSRMWTTQILFPQISSVCSHVTLLPGHMEGDSSWLFAFDHSLMSYRAVRTDDTRAGVAYFLSPPGADRFDTPLPTVAPSATICGTMAVAAFEGPSVWIYGIPERLDISPDMGAVIERQNERQTNVRGPMTTATGNMEPLMAYSPSNSANDYSIEDDSLANKVDWRQSLFVKCKHVHGLPGQTAARWVEQVDGPNLQSSKRLVIVAPGGVSLEGDDLGEEMMPVDGSRLCLLDFDYAPSKLHDQVITIEVGEDEAELLTEHTGSLATEVALERRRTIRAMPSIENTRIPLGRSVTSILPPLSPLNEVGVRRNSISTPSSPIELPRSSQPPTASSNLHRAATASGFRHARYPPRPPLGSSQNSEPNQAGYQRLNHYGRPTSEDSWETPPPPYTGANSPLLTQHAAYLDMNMTREPRSSANPVVSPARSVGQPEAHQYRPYRALMADRASVPPAINMSSNAAPSGTLMNHYEELAMAARSRGASDTSSDLVVERRLAPPNSHPSHPNQRHGFASRQNQNSAMPIRPMTHHGGLPQGWQRVGRNMTVPIPTMSIGNYHDMSENRISLTGANLQNRLNHPVPPIPEIPRSFEPQLPYHDSQHMADNDDMTHQIGQANNMPPAMPTAGQVANLQRRISNSEMQRPPAIKNTHFVHRAPVLTVPPSPPRGAWGATGIAGSPTINQARNVPNGFALSRPTSQASQTSHLASVSAPNLLAQRPTYGRLDTIESLNDAMYQGEMNHALRSRSHSMTQVVVQTPVEPSAYHETSRVGSGLANTKAKKSKKKKEEAPKKGSRCVVM